MPHLYPERCVTTRAAARRSLRALPFARSRQDMEDSEPGPISPHPDRRVELRALQGKARGASRGSGGTSRREGILVRGASHHGYQHPELDPPGSRQFIVFPPDRLSGGRRIRMETGRCRFPQKATSAVSYRAAGSIALVSDFEPKKPVPFPLGFGRPSENWLPPAIRR